MSFADTIEPPKTGGRPCVTCTFLDDLDADLADEVRAALADRRFGTAAIHDKLVKDHGYPFTYSAFYKHRVAHA